MPRTLNGRHRRQDGRRLRQCVRTQVNQLLVRNEDGKAAGHRRLGGLDDPEIVQKRVIYSFPEIHIHQK